MTIKKPMSIKRPTEPAPAEGAPAAASAAPAAATIADRFKLDAPAEKPRAAFGVGAKIALAAGLVALGIAGLLAYMLWQHWQFLMPA